MVEEANLDDSKLGAGRAEANLSSRSENSSLPFFAWLATELWEASREHAFTSSPYLAS